MKKDITSFLLIVAGSVGGFFVGKKQLVNTNQSEKNIKTIEQISIVELNLIKDDLLHISVPENVRILWSEGKNSLETSGDQVVPIGQIDTENSKKLAEFKYVGNAKTKKYYPALSYPARGTEIRYRRFFDTKEAANKAGFVASKLVK